MSNTFGHIFRLTSFGESHGPAIGGVIDGMPPGVDIDMDFIAKELARRRPGQSQLTTSRKESDSVQFLSGIFEGRSTGCPIGFIVKNMDQHSNDYDNLRDVFRPSHADFTYQSKYGIRDYTGGGRQSARETVARQVAGALAKLALRKVGVEIYAYTSQVGTITIDPDYRKYNRELIETNAVRCPDPFAAEKMEAYIKRVSEKGDTVGGVVTGVIQGCPLGLGEPVADKLHAALGAAMLSINAAKGFEYGLGFSGTEGLGSEQNDLFTPAEGEKIDILTNHSGGIQGGISNGKDVYFRVAFKPVATLLKEQPTVTIAGKHTIVKARGRHDPCVLPRAVPIVEAMAAMTILDFYLLNKTTHL